MNEQELNRFTNPFDAAITAVLSRESYAGTSSKRRASPSFDGPEENSSRKRIKEDIDDDIKQNREHSTVNSPIESRLVDELAEELQCGCCSELVYRPVIVAPCQHFFCGSCCVLWIRNGGTNCPACRGLSTVVTPFRALQGILDTLLRIAPYKARTERERQQADEVYKIGHSMRLPPPREASPELNINLSTEYARPCPHCAPGNPYGWRCPEPIPDPNTDVENAWHLEDGTPPGHAHCGNCENLLAIRAPTTTKCDLCQVAFCGIGVQGRCLAAPLSHQHPHGMSEIGDLIQSADVYESFDSNTVEVEIMLDYLFDQNLTPRHIYREIIAHIQSQPRGFSQLLEQDIFMDMHGVAPIPDPNPGGPRRNICRLCATEVFLWGIRDWWVRERQKGFLPTSVTNRKDCPEGSDCEHQRDFAHAKEFNHIIVTPGPEPQEPKEPEPNHPVQDPTPAETEEPAPAPTEAPNTTDTTESPTATDTADFTPPPENENTAPASPLVHPATQPFSVNISADIGYYPFPIPVTSSTA